MGSCAQCVLAINAGSSSVKFAVYARGDPSRRREQGSIDRIGAPGTRFRHGTGHDAQERELGTLAREDVADFLIDWLAKRCGLDTLLAAGHRVAHGGPNHVDPQRVTDDVLDELHRISIYAPEHVPFELALIERFRERAPKLEHVVCFDTAFHRRMPLTARLLPLPRRLYRQGVERYGFHGLSYAFLMEELDRVAGADAARGRVILAHLGNGASLAAVRDGKSVDTSMAFTPTAGVPMSNRSGDLDPGLVLYLARHEGMSAEQFHRMVNHESGLLGVSETSSDVRDLLDRECGDVRAAEALAMFCYHVTKWIGAFSAALGGVDTLVFAGGIGENAPVIRERICERLGFLGIELDAGRNAAGASVVSCDAVRAVVRVIRTDEEIMIAKAVERVLAGAAGAGA